jgi:hypothetical protein
MRYEIKNALPLETELSVGRRDPGPGDSRDLTLYFHSHDYRQGMQEILTMLDIRFELIGGRTLVTMTNLDEMRIVRAPQYSYANLMLAGTNGGIILAPIEGTLSILSNSDELPTIILSIVRRWSPNAEMTAM